VSSDDLAEVAAELDALAERLADMALDRLRDAVDPDGGGDAAAAAAEERRITRARRAVEKASGLLTPAERTRFDDATE
jgi:hypothetical protein